MGFSIVTRILFFEFGDPAYPCNAGLQILEEEEGSGEGKQVEMDESDTGGVLSPEEMSSQRDVMEWLAALFFYKNGTYAHTSSISGKRRNSVTEIDKGQFTERVK